ncbi:MAG: VWA domain-containing protein, partial [Candidatus Methanomethylicus sp.]|nr:VWA domain-containing protein [Candidatus Methanomethylicus sp.]
INRYPGLKRDFATYFSNSFLHHHNLQDVPEEFRFATALVQYASFGRAKGDLSSLRESQKEKIISVIALLDGIKWACLFERDLLTCAEEIHRLIASELKGHNLEAGLSLIQNSISDEVIEENQQKYETHTKPVEDAEPNTPGLRALGISGKGKSDFIDQVRQEFSRIYGISLEPTAVETKLIDDIFGSDTRQGPLNLKTMREDRIKGHFSKNPLDIMLPLENLDFYYQCKAEIQHQIKCLTCAFQSIKQAEDWDENYLSGQNLAHDFLQRLLNDDRHLFKRYIEKDYDTKWLILTDVSSSVKASEVTRLTIILSEVANTVFNRSDFCMCAFSNNFYVIKDFNEGYDKTVKSRIGGMYSGGTTNICDSIDFCVNRFEKFPSETKVLLVITDGEPNTCGSKDPREHTKAAVKRAFAKDVFTIGIGTHDNVGIQKYFPISFTIDSFDSFPRLFLGIMAKVLFEPEVGISKPPG